MATVQIAGTNYRPEDKAKYAEAIKTKNYIAMLNLIMFIGLLLIIALAIYSNNMGYTQLSNIIILFAIGTALVITFSEMTHYNWFGIILLAIILILSIASAIQIRK